MSDVDIATGPFRIFILYLLFGGPGLMVGGIIGALLWRKNRTRGAEIGAVLGFWLCILAVWVWTVN
jgi:hypothetical protein